MAWLEDLDTPTAILLGVVAIAVLCLIPRLIIFVGTGNDCWDEGKRRP